MRAKLITAQRIVLRPDIFQEMVIWRLPKKLPGSTHNFKYRLALVHQGRCVLRYDNEAGKGDHRRIRGKEEPYAFTSIEQLLADFDQSTEEYRHGYVGHW